MVLMVKEEGTDNLCIWQCLEQFILAVSATQKENVLTREPLKLAREYYSNNKLKHKDVRATKLMEF